MTTGLVGQGLISTFSTPINGTANDANVVRGNDNTAATGTNTHISDPSVHLQSSVSGSRPVAATAGIGAKWIDNDTYRVYYSDGSAWHEIAYLLSGGSVPASTVTAGTFGAGDYVFPAKLNVVGDFSVATTKFTVAASTGNTVVAGSLNSTGRIGANGGLDVTGGSNFLQIVNTTPVAAGSIGTHFALFGSGSINNLAISTLGQLELYTNNSATVAVTVATTGAMTLASTLAAGASSTIGWTGRSQIQSPSDGVIEITNAAGTDFSFLKFGGTTNAFPAIWRESSRFHFRLADDSGDAGLVAGAINGTLGVQAAGGLLQIGTMATTNSSSGNICITSGSAPTGNPTGGGFLWVEAGVLKYRGTSGTVTTVAPA
jgi:hypothetical protein